MNLLVDTHLLIWWLRRDPRLVPSALALLVNPANTLLISSVSGFEIASKVGAGKLNLSMDAATFIGAAIRQGNMTELPLLLRHTYRVAQLPAIHRDPFDRLLIATALEDGLTLLTNDHLIRTYPIPVAW